MSGYHYGIMGINEDERWIYLSSDGGWDTDEPDAFLFLLKKIRNKFGWMILDLGNDRYQFREDELKLIYQWDSCFGIVVEYINKMKAIEFLNDFL